MEAFLSSLRELTFGTMCLRIMLSMLLGGFLGFDREIWGRPAGFRTYMLVAMAAAATSILSQYLNLMLDTCWKEAYSAVGNRTDVVRFGAQVVSGIGFLGTGTILITQRKEVTGLTTACCLWAAGCMGLAIGAGFYECVLVGFLIIFIALRVLSPLDRVMLSSSTYMNIFMELDSVRDLYLVSEWIKTQGVTVYDVEMGKAEKAGVDHVTGVFSIRLPRRKKHTEVLADLAMLPGVAAIEEV